MKKLLLLFACLFGMTYSLQAQKLVDGSLDFLKGETTLTVIYDYSEMQLEQMSMKDFLFVRFPQVDKREKWFKSWNEETIPDLKEKFLLNFNKALINNKVSLRSIDAEKSNYQATIKVLSVTKKGNTTADVIFTRVNSNEPLAKISIFAKGGHYGTLENLMGDGSKHLGTKLALFIAKKIR
jgi:hypothetical protein